jgi:prephenate dehydrogenase
MRLFNRVAIVGTGLIGGSMGLAIKKRKLAREVIGVSRHKKTLSLAKRAHAIDRGSQDLKSIKDADLVILAVPVDTILKLAPAISKIIRKECFVTDVGSTKQGIVAKLNRIFPRFIGSHPLAGSQKRGVLNANFDLFKGSLCILTPAKDTQKTAQEKIKRLWVQLGARVIVLAPQTHDKILSFTSHLPHVAAFSLISAVPKQFLKFASTGLGDTTRIAASEAELWSDIFLSNRGHLLCSIAALESNLSRIKSAIKQRDKKLLNKILKGAKAKRDSLDL